MDCRADSPQGKQKQSVEIVIYNRIFSKSIFTTTILNRVKLVVQALFPQIFQRKI